MVDIGLVSFYLGLKIKQNQENRTIKLSQPAYIDKIFNKFHLDKAHTINTPIKESLLLQPRIKSEVTISSKQEHQEMTEFIMVSMVEIKANILFVT